jgi:hypothetical protein
MKTLALVRIFPIAEKKKNITIVKSLDHNRDEHSPDTCHSTIRSKLETSLKRRRGKEHEIK